MVSRMAVPQVERKNSGCVVLTAAYEVLVKVSLAVENRVLSGGDKSYRSRFIFFLVRIREASLLCRLYVRWIRRSWICVEAVRHWRRRARDNCEVRFRSLHRPSQAR